MSTGYVWHTLYGWIDPGNGSILPADISARLQPLPQHPAHPDTKRRLHELIVASGTIDALVPVPAREATVAELERVHLPAHVERIRTASDDLLGGQAGDGTTLFGKGSFEVAALAAGGVMELVRAVVEGQVDNGYALVHPAGHHATRASGMGLCLFNNVAAAAAYARETLGLERVAIVDWDVHHGNGTQDIFFDDPNVLTISLHQERWYPSDSGFHEERGSGAGTGACLNVPLPAGSGDPVYLRALSDVVIPALERFSPDLILVACGYDASAFDPLGRQQVTAEGFRALTAAMVETAGRLCGGRLVFTQEGGYNLGYTPLCGLAVVRELSGQEPYPNPWRPMTDAMTEGVEVQPHHAEALQAAAALVPGVPARG